MKTSRELTIYYVENKCPSKVVNTIVYSYEPAFKWAARHKVLRKANEPNTYFFEELPPLSEENYHKAAAELQELIREV